MKKILLGLTVSIFILSACEETDEPVENTENEETVEEVVEAEESTDDDIEADLDEVEEEEDSQATEEQPDEEDTETVEEDDDGLLTVGDSITINDITVTITSSEFVDERNQFADEDPDDVIAIYFTIDNESDSDYPVGIDFDVYVDGSKASTYPNENTMDSISPGRSIDGVTHYGVDGEVVEAEWEPLLSFSDEKGIWDVTP